MGCWAMPPDFLSKSGVRPEIPISIKFQDSWILSQGPHFENHCWNTNPDCCVSKGTFTPRKRLLLFLVEIWRRGTELVPTRQEVRVKMRMLKKIEEG